MLNHFRKVSALSMIIIPFNFIYRWICVKVPLKRFKRLFTHANFFINCQQGLLFANLVKAAAHPLHLPYVFERHLIFDIQLVVLNYVNCYIYYVIILCMLPLWCIKIYRGLTTVVIFCAESYQFVVSFLFIAASLRLASTHWFNLIDYIN